MIRTPFEMGHYSITGRIKEQSQNPMDPSTLSPQRYEDYHYEYKLRVSNQRGLYNPK